MKAVKADPCLLQLEKDFDNGRYRFKAGRHACSVIALTYVQYLQIENVIFSMKDYSQMMTETHDEVLQFKERQRQGVAAEEEKYVSSHCTIIIPYNLTCIQGNRATQGLAGQKAS